MKSPSSLQKRKLNIRLFNVVILNQQYHNSKYYIELFEHIQKEGKTYVINSEKRIRIHSYGSTDDLLYGTVVNYTKLTGKNWYDEETNVITEVDLKDTLNPNSKQWTFYFQPSTHCIAVPSTNRVSYPQIIKYFQLSLNNASEVLGFGEISVTPVVSSSYVKDIQELDCINSLSIKVHYSNNDNNEAADDIMTIMDKQLKSQNVQNLEVKASGTKGNPIKLIYDTFLSGILLLSEKNGSATAKGTKDSREVTLHTEDYPRVISVSNVTENNILSKIKEAIYRRNDKN